MKKIIFRVIICVYLLIAIMVTIFLLNYDEHRATKLGKNTLVNVERNVGNLSKYDLVIAKKQKGFNEGDEIYYFEKVNGKNIIKTSKIDSLNVKKNYVNLMNVETVKNKDILSKTSEVKSIAVLGGILSFLESKWGYLCFITLPIMLIFVFEIYSISKEINKKGKK